MKINLVALTRQLGIPVAAGLLYAGSSNLAADDYPTVILSDNPVAYYRLEELPGATVATDSSPSHFDGAYNFDNDTNNVPLWPQLGQPGIDTNSIAFHPYIDAGSTHHFSTVSVPFSETFNPDGPFSVEFWARPASLVPSTGDYRSPVSSFGGFTAANNFNGSGWLFYQSPGANNWILDLPGNAVFSQSPTPAVALKWDYLAATYDGTNANFYVNGTLVSASPVPLANYLVNDHNDILIGTRDSSYGYFDGNVDEVAIYGAALGPDRIAAHYHLGTNSFRLGALPPTITQAPAAVTNYAGTSVHFAVGADGTSPLAYQWYKGTNGIPGATGATLDFICSLADNGALYSAVVTNAYGKIQSPGALLTVSTNLLVDSGPTSIKRSVGSAAAFEVVAEGALPISYQWYQGAAPVPGATNSVLWLSNIPQAADQSTYYVAISNPYTSTNSDPATLSVSARATTVPLTGYGKIVADDGPIAFWRLDETSGTTATDAVGSFDGTYTDASSGMTGTFTYGTTTGIPNETDPAVTVAGGATVSIPYAIELNPIGPFSAEGWFKPASLGTDGGDYRTVFSSIYNPPDRAGPTGWLLYQQPNGTFAWVPYGGYYASVFITDSADTIVPNTWYHIALTYDGDRFVMYVNGRAATGAPYPGFVPNGNVPTGGTADYVYNYYNSGSGPTTLGWRSDAGFNPFSGAMDDVAFYNKALTAAQVLNHYYNGGKLSITLTGNSAVITWPIGILVQSATVDGSYTPVAGATSPYTTAPGGTTFYRFQTQ